MSEEDPEAKKGFNWARSLQVDAYLCLVAGVGIGLLALAGPLAIWIGVADFRLVSRQMIWDTLPQELKETFAV
jgi:hypothetical protein